MAHLRGNAPAGLTCRQAAVASAASSAATACVHASCCCAAAHARTGVSPVTLTAHSLLTMTSLEQDA